MFDDIELDIEDLELFIEEYDSIPQIVESFNFLDVFIEVREEIIEMR